MGDRQTAQVPKPLPSFFFILKVAGKGRTQCTLTYRTSSPSPHLHQLLQKLLAQVYLRTLSLLPSQTTTTMQVFGRNHTLVRILNDTVLSVVPRLKAVQDLFRTSAPVGDPPQPLPRTLLPSPHPAGGLQYPDPNRPNTALRFPQLQSLYNKGQPNFSSLPPSVQRTLSPQPLRHNSASSSSGIVKSSSWGEDLRSSISNPATSTPIRSDGGAPKPRPKSIASQPQLQGPQQSWSQGRLSLDSKIKEEGRGRKDPTSLMDFDLSQVHLAVYLNFIPIVSIFPPLQ